MNLYNTNFDMRLSRTAALGFTLVELLVVMAIILVLAAIILPLLSAGDVARDKAVTNSLAVKVDRAIKLAGSKYRTEFLSCYREGDAPESWGNHFFYRLSKDKSEAELVAMKTDLATRHTQLTTNWTYATLEIDNYQGTTPNGTWNPGARTTYFNGVMKEMRKRETALFRAEHYTAEFLDRNDIPAEFIIDHTDDRGATHEAVADAYGNPLIHAVKYEPGVPAKQYYTTWQNWKSLGYTKFLRGGRTAIKDLNSNGIDDEARASDIRADCFEGFEHTHEIWSAGPDEMFNPIRGEMENEDNFTFEESEYQGQQ